ncbi:MAG: DUF308 domain-containing protein [Sphingobacterium sp.]|jgi:uncharacterized membrane protein HdeD (DUF308 family)|uniref:HdeD family acid-resistance protein n=1 Tax=Sphingobacterium sp. TaxID=341027 RepID=UPI0028514197|nr:DUF308 domain-containing protein [Sphingobacterium sp.]MDR3007032.1 DUF308 domain-containing protein [Sphingobacterium sp.]
MANSFFKTIRTSIKHWYIPLIIGILLILLGFYTISTPVAAFLTLAILFSWSFIISGILEIIFAVQNKDEVDGWGWYLTGGILYTLFGILLIANPLLSASTLAFIVGFYALFKSFQLLSFSFDLKNYGSKSWGWNLLFAILGIIFSFILLWNPLFAGFSLVIWTGMAISTVGFAACVFAFQLKSLKDIPNKLPDEWKERYQKLKEEFDQHRK